MMNLVQLQEQLKDYSQQQLAKEMQMPSGNVPQYLILGELQRRKRMESSAMQDQAQQNQTTVAQDAVAAAGVPQQGLGGMMQAMAPKTDMGMNTGQAPAPVQQMASGGYVQRMADGGEMDSGYLNLLLTDPATRALASRMGMSVSQYIEQMDPRALQANAQRVMSNKRGAPSLSDVLDPNRPAYDQASSLDLEETFPQMRNNIRDQEVMAMGVNPSYATDMRDRAVGMGISDLPMTAPEPDTLAELSPFVDRPVRRLNTVTGGSNYMTPDLAIPGLDEAPSLSDTQGSLRTDLNNALDRMYGPEYSMDTGPTSRRGTRAGEQFAGAAPVPPTYPGWGADTSAAPFSSLGSFVDSLTGERGSLPQDNYVNPANEFGGVSAPYGTEEDTPAGNPITELLGLGPAMDLVEQSRIAGDVSRQVEDLSGLAGADLLPPNVIPAAEPSATTTTPEAAIAATEAAAGGAGSTGGTGGSGGSSLGGSSLGGSGKAVMSDLEKSLEQDKWLALAKFGLGLMASKEPTLGGAIGEAGIGAIGDFQQAKRNFEEARLARATLAARRSGSGGSSRTTPTISNMISYLDDLVRQRGELAPLPGMAPTPDQVMQASALDAEIAAVRGQLRASGMGAAPALSAVSSTIRTPSATTN